MVHVETLVVVCILAMALTALVCAAMWRKKRAVTEQSGETDLEALVRERTLELRRAQTDLVQAEKLASVGLIAAGVAHEINNPAAYVLTNLTLLRESLTGLRAQRQAFAGTSSHVPSPLPSKAEMDASDWLADETLRDAVEGLLRIRDIVADLRSLAQKDAREPEPVRLAKVVETSAALALPTIRLRASLELSLDQVSMVLGHPGKLSQVVINLIVNAAEAMSEPLEASGSSRPGRIEIRTLSLPNEIALEVRDNGRGIPAAQLGEIFRPLHTTKRSGTGLGLTICRRIVEEHQGRIEVESIVGEGTTFRVVLPELADPGSVGPRDLRTGPFLSLAAVTSESLTVAGEPLGESPIAAPPATSASVDDRKLVMIVDDEALLLKVLARFLGRSHRVAAAASVDEALRLVREGAVPAIVLCDLMMPGKSGAELYVALQRERPELAARITFMSGGGTDEKLNQFPLSVGRPTLVKPLEPDVLLAYIEARLAIAGSS